MHSFEVHSNERACRKKACLGLEQVMDKYNMIWTNIIHNGLQVVPGITHLFVRNYMEKCSRDLLEMKELTI